VFYFYQYYWIMLPAILLSFIAQSMVTSSFNKYKTVRNERNITGEKAARMILDKNGLSHIKVERVTGKLTDHYDPKDNVIRLSNEVYDNTSVAAVGIAAHEAGHAVQHSTAYIPVKVRNAILPVAQISSQAAVPLIIIGFIFSGFSFLIELGIILFSAAVVFQVITLPVEFNASSRAVQTIGDMDILSDSETKGAKKVLRAAALTYIAAALAAVLQLLRLILIYGGGSGRRRS
jgi:Zn-dependent membrane protease YugP